MYIACTQFLRCESSTCLTADRNSLAQPAPLSLRRGPVAGEPPPVFLDDYLRSRLFCFCVSICVCLATLRMVHIYQVALLCMRHPYISVSVFFVCVLSLPEGTDCQKRGGQADLLFCLLSGHSSEHWPSPKLKPPATHWTQHSDAPTGIQWHWIICACQFVGNEKDRRKWPCILNSTMVVLMHPWMVEGCFSICNWVVWRTSVAKASQDEPCLFLTLSLLTGNWQGLHLGTIFLMQIQKYQLFKLFYSNYVSYSLWIYAICAWTLPVSDLKLFTFAVILMLLTRPK